LGGGEQSGELIEFPVQNLGRIKSLFPVLQTFENQAGKLVGNLRIDILGILRRLSLLFHGHAEA